MKIHLIAVGIRMPAWVTEGYQEYAQRLPSHYSLKLIEIPAIKRSKSRDIARIMQQEGEQLLAAVPPGDHLIALSERGRLWNTQTLAQQLQAWQNSGIQVSLLIGGPEGLSPACFAAAHQQWSLSPLTFPHPLVRILVAEQIYRAWSIIHHHPYHRS